MQPIAIVDWNPLHLLHGPWFWAAFSGWMLAQLIKMAINFIRLRTVDFEYLVSTGGMPSAHSSLVCALFTSIGLTEGFDAPVTMLAVGFAAITMFDAAVVRRAAGRQARVLNEICRELRENDRISFPRLKELLGHTRKEVFAGMALGIAVAYAVVYVWALRCPAGGV